MNHLIVLPLAILLAGAGAQLFLARALSGRAKGWLAVAFGAAAFVAVALLWPTIHGGSTLDLHLGSSHGLVALTFHVDGLSLLFALMGAGIGTAVLLYSVGYMASDPAATRFYVLMQIFIAGLITLVFASNLLLMYAGWELIGLCSFLLVGFWYTQKEAAAGARKVLVMTHIAGYALLAAILILYARTGATLWTDPRVGPAFTTGLFALMLIAAIAKSVQFPLHTWIPSAMAAPTPVSSLLHAACYVKAGVYLVARMHSFTTWPAGWQTTVVWIGTVTMVVGVLFAMIQHDSKRLLAFHTVSQIGYMMLGLGLGTPLGVVAALLHCLNHGLFKGGLFLGAGAVQHATGTRDMDRLGGLSKRMPKTTVLWLICAASIAGVPLFNGFVSKWLLYVAALNAGFPVPALLAWVVSVLTTFSFMKASSGMFFGDETEASAGAQESPRSMLAGGAMLATLCVVFGVAPQLAIDGVVAPALASMDLHADLHLSWLGVSAGSAAWYTTAGLVLALVAVLGGALLYRFSTRRARLALVAASAPAGASAVRRAPGAGGPAAGALTPLTVASSGAAAGTFSGGEPLTSQGRLHAGDFSVTIRHSLAPFYDWVAPDRYYLAVWRATLRLCAAAGRAGDWLERRMLFSLPLVALAIALIAGLGAGTAGRAVNAPQSAIWPLTAAVAASAAALVLATFGDERLRGGAWLVALTGVLATGALLLSPGLGRLLVLEGAAIMAFIVLLQAGADRAVRAAYLVALALSAGCLIAGTALLEGGPHGLVVALLVAGFAVKLALVPAYLWLPRVAERTPALLVGLVVAVVDVTAVAELVAVRTSDPSLFAPAWPWLALALLSAVGGAGLALAQRDVKRLLAFSSITDVGFIVLAVGLAGRFGLAGAVLAASAHALGKTLLFACVAGAERDGRVTLASRGLAVRHPLAAAGFVAGALTVLGVPPTVGFAGHWRIYETAYGGSWAYLALLIVATALSVLAYTRVIAVVWWGPERATAPSPGAGAPVERRSIWRSEAWPLAAIVVALIVVVLATGVWALGA
ncbi:MAG TPA: proton-conducting transporter membrane subunit [Thermoleophilia bacterium]|nr:proton-conducting transporter membrane subunit [Thermoleophilia bacterium]